MPQKRFDLQTFKVPLKDGGDLVIECSSARTKYGTSQRAETWYIGVVAGSYAPAVLVRGHSRYCNRLWESFPYENAIHDLAKKLAPVDRAAVLEWCEKHLEERRREANAFFADFKSEWDKASPGLKDALAAGGPLETEDQAKSAIAVLKMGNFLRSIENADNN